MKRIIVTLLATALVFAATLLTTSQYVRQKATEEADSTIARLLDNFDRELEGNLLKTRNAVYGFLTGIFTKKTTGSDDYLLVDDRYKELNHEELYSKLSSFMHANPYYHSAMFIFQKEGKEGTDRESYHAPMLEVNRDSLEDVSLRYDFSKSSNLQRCRNTLKSFWATPSSHSLMSGYIITFYVPLCSERDGQFKGAFALSIANSLLEKCLEKHSPYQSESRMFLSNENGQIIASYPTRFKKLGSLENVERSLMDEGTYKSVREDYDKGIIEYKGETFLLYRRQLVSAPWTIITACKNNSVYQRAEDETMVILITSLIGFALMLLALIIITQQVRRTHNAKLIAEQELTMAASVQAHILRQPTFKTAYATLKAFIKPAREAGGDLYDYCEVDNKLVFLIGDVSGKGMPAALFMTQVVSLFRSALLRTTCPDAIVSSINDVLAASNPDMTFCTLFVGTIEDGKHLTYCNAGHNKPVILGQPPHANFVNPNPNIAVGLMAGFPFVSEQMSLSPDQTLLVYTDGVNEAKNRLSQMYGEQTILDTLSHRSDNDLSSCINMLVSSVSHFVGNAPQSDDITLLALRTEEKCNE